MPAPIALQLYTVRELAAKDYEGVVRKVAELGYVGVEPAGFPGTTVEKAAALFKSLGLEVSSAHLPMPIGDKKNEAIEAAAKLGCKKIVSGFGPDKFATAELIKQTCDVLNEAAANATAAGLTFCMHNHWWEFSLLAGSDKRVYEIMLQHLTPQVCFQVDTYWVKTGGADPAAVIKQLGKRAPLLHMKDGPAVKDQPMTAVGDGILDWPAITKAGAKTAEWHIVELDRCATDMMEAVAKSYAFLVGKKLSRGKKAVAAAKCGCCCR